MPWPGFIQISFPTSAPSFVSSFYSLPPSLVPPRSSQLFHTVHRIDHLSPTYPDGNPNVRIQRAQGLGCTTPGAHASSLSRTAQNQPVQTSFQTRTMPRRRPERLIRRRDVSRQRCTRQVIDAFCAALHGYNASRLMLGVRRASGVAIPGCWTS